MPNAPAAKASVNAIQAAAPQHITLGEGPDESALDTNVAACDDFYSYACGTWTRTTPIPEDQTTWMRSFSVIRQENEKLLRDLLEEYAKGNVENPKQKALGDYYAACMDEPAIEKNGLAPLAADLKAIGALKTRTDLVKLLARFRERGIHVLFEFAAQQDLKDATLVIGAFDQAAGGESLGLPEREYYLKDDPRMKEIRGKYIEHLARILELSGVAKGSAKSQATGVLAFETELAKVSMTKEDLRDPDKLFHRIERSGLKAAAPALDWDTYLSDLGLAGVTTLNVSQPDFFAALSTMLEGLPSGAKTATKAEEVKAGATTATATATTVPKVKLSDLQAYLRFHLVDSIVGKLPARFVDEAFHFQRELTGAEKLPPRWKRCTRAVDAALGESLAEGFVKKTIGQEGKQVTLAMIADIEHAMNENIQGLAWMDAETKKPALEKLSLIGNKIAFPDKMRDYSELEKKVQRTSYVDNAFAANAFETRRTLTKIGKPVDRTEWHMTPPTVNAYYDPQMNEIVFPAGILQPPFYANKASLAVNYGAVGMVMGHELTHGFDDEGSKFDAKGNLREWWSKKSFKEFSRRATCVEEQFNGYTALGNLKVNGKLTNGENIADLGGLKIAHAALMSRLGDKIIDNPSKFTPSQQFFLGFAQAWCGNYRDKALEVLVNTNPHSPPKFRVNGPLSNLPEFARAFSCKPGSPMARKDRCEIW